MLYLWIRNWLVVREEGQDLAEYALLIGLIALVVIGAVTILGGQITAMFDAIGSQLVVPGIP